MTSYKDFLSSKRIKTEFTGFEPSNLNPGLFDFQKDVVTWSCRKGKAALFEDCGLGKTIQQLSWANQVHQHTHDNVLILAPLAVSMQTQREGEKFGIPVNIARNQGDVARGINITNYEMLDHFNTEQFSGVVLDESSILKNYSGKIRNTIIQKFRDTPFKLACTATPSPNDLMELGNHAEFLTDVTRAEMLAMFFVHDSGDTGKWRLKKHAEREFWEWVCTWAVMLRNPQEIGYNQCDYDLPALNIIDGCIPTDIEVPEKMGLNARRKVRRATIRERCELAASIVNYSEGPFIVWCDLNDESAMLNEMIHGAVEIRGTDPSRKKELAIQWFSGNNNVVLIGNKLMEIESCQMKHTPKNTTEKTGIEGSQKQENGKKTIVGNEKNIWRTIGQRILKNGKEQKNRKIRLMPPVEKNMRRIKNTGSVAGQTPKNTTNETQTPNSIKDSKSTDLTQINTEQWLNCRVEDVRFAAQKILDAQKKKDSTLTIAMKQELLEDYYVQIATKESENFTMTLGYFLKLLDTSKKCLVSKPSIYGYGVNLQNCNNQIFVGLSDSYEQYYQAVRRCWRFGQTKSVNVHIIYSDKEGAVVENIRRKERMHNDMFESMVNSMQPISGAQIRQESIKKEYAPTLDIQLPFNMMEN